MHIKKSHIATMLIELLNNSERTVDAVISEYFADSYRQRTDGEWSNRAEFAAHITHLRQIVDRVQVDVVDEVHDGVTYADRHIARITKVDGSVVVHEVYLFGKLAADGRFTTIHETTLMLDGADDDRRIGSAR